MKPRLRELQANNNAVRQRRHKKRVRQGKAVLPFEYQGEHLTVLERLDCLPPGIGSLDGPAYDAALGAALQKFWSDVFDGKITVTRYL
jgi:hypothetical protein